MIKSDLRRRLLGGSMTTREAMLQLLWMLENGQDAPPQDMRKTWSVPKATDHAEAIEISQPVGRCDGGGWASADEKCPGCRACC